MLEERCEFFAALLRWQRWPVLWRKSPATRHLPPRSRFCSATDGRGRSGKPNASPPDVRCGPSMGLRSLEVLLAFAFQASLAEPHRRNRIGLPLAALKGAER